MLKSSKISVPMYLHGISGIIIGLADYNWFIKTGAAVANHVFYFCCDTRPIDMFPCLG